MPVIFRVSSRLGMFRKWWTTTSSVSYPFPPPTAVAGLIGAILGFETSDTGEALYWDKLKGSQVAVRIEDYKLISLGVNFINTKNFDGHTQIMHQFVKNATYTIFYKGPHEKELYNMLDSGEVHFTPYLGVAYAITKPEFVGYEPHETVVQTDVVDTIIPVLHEGIEVDFVKNGGRVFYEKVALRMSKQRVREDIIGVMYGKGSLYLKKPISASKVGNMNVVWFPKW